MSTIDLILAGTLFVCQSPGIYDGDTWRCADGTRVRAWGIDAPEASTPLGRPAARTMAGIIAGQDLNCQRRGTSYNRVVAYCTTPEGLDVSEALVRAGFAQDCPRYSRGLYAHLRPADGPVLPQRHKSCEVK